jgi:FKBP-type peptidyl-prolyl cis-trans isomerase
MLIFGKVRKKPKPQGNPPWLTWSVTALILYMIYNQYMDRKNGVVDGKLQTNQTENQSVNQAASTNVTQNMVPTEPTIQASKAEVKKEKSTPEISEKITIRGDIEGRGVAASCGHLLQINYDESAPENPSFKAKENISLEIKSGLKATSLWQESINGMKVGGVRQINLKANDVYSEKQLTENNLKASDILEYKIELKSLEPAQNPDEITMQIIDNKIGDGEQLKCTQQAEVAVTLWGIDGKKLYETDAKSPLKSRIGYNDYFYGLDQTLLDMQIGGERTAIIPPSYAALNKSAESIFKEKIVANQMVVVQVKLLAIK